MTLLNIDPCKGQILVLEALPVVSKRGLQHTEHAQCRLHAAIEVGVAEGVASADEQRAVEDGHLTRTVRHRGQHLQEGREGS